MVGNVGITAVGDEAFGFRVKEVRDLPDVSSRMWRMEFVANGADLVWLENDDKEKTFAIAFRTLPEDDTGVAHIIEHSVLCGSERFPVKSPFKELAHSSCATFLNAFTSSDCTYYPVSTCNDQDLLNLAEVYLDAVFAPLSLKSDWAMQQERNVVLNEMKGATSSPDSIAFNELSRMLFPSNTYGRVSGGDPAAIPSLTHEAYREFYKRFYHPSNALVFLHGKVDLMPMLKLLESYLGRYQRRDVPPQPDVQPPVSAEKTIEYQCDTVLDRTCLYEGWVFGSWREEEDAVAMALTSGYLAGSNDAPIAKALLDAGVCDDICMGCVYGCQNYIYANFVNVRDERLDEARRMFRETLERLVRDGFDQERIAAILDRYEFKLREREHFLNPTGIDMAGSVIESWSHGGDPVEGIAYPRLVESLRAKNGTGYYERLFAEAIFGSNHHATLVMKPTDKPKPDVAAPSAPSVKAPDDDPSDLARIPRLRLADIPEEGDFTTWKVEYVDGIEVVLPNVENNGIAYATLAFRVDDLTEAELLDLPLLAFVLCDVPAGGRDVSTLHKHIKSRLGCFSVSALGHENGAWLEVGISLLPRHAEDALRLVKDILTDSDFSHDREIDDIRRQKRNGFEERMLSPEWLVAAKRASRSHSSKCSVQEIFSGLSQYRHLKCDACGDLAKLAKKVFTRGRLTVSVTNAPSPDFVHRLVKVVPVGGAPSIAALPLYGREASSDGFITKGRGAVTAMCAMLPEGIADSGAFMLAAQILSTGFIDDEIRVKGGAYGGCCSFEPDRRILLGSWDDPRPSDTFNVFSGCGTALREFVKSGQSLDGYKISLSGDCSTLSPWAKSFLAFTRHVNGITVADLQRWRNEMLHATSDDMLRCADILDEALPNATRCVIGEESLVKSCGLPEFAA